MIAKYVLLAPGLLAMTDGSAGAQGTTAASSQPLLFAPTHGLA